MTREQLAEFYYHHRSKAIDMLKRVTRASNQDAQDAVQTAMLEFLSHIDHVHGLTFPAFFTRAHSRYVDIRRKQAREQPLGAASAEEIAALAAQVIDLRAAEEQARRERKLARDRSSQLGQLDTCPHCRRRVRMVPLGKFWIEIRDPQAGHNVDEHRHVFTCVKPKRNTPRRAA